jgi:HEAT repeat protein
VINEGDHALRSIACYALGRQGAAAKPAVPLLRRLLSSRDPHEKTVAAWALVQIAPDAETIQTAIPLLLVALRHGENPEIRAEAAKALGKIGTDAAVKEALTAAQKDPDASVQKAAGEALKQLK